MPVKWWVKPIVLCVQKNINEVSEFLWTVNVKELQNKDIQNINIHVCDSIINSPRPAKHW
jgi:hypothetical protein